MGAGDVKLAIGVGALTGAFGFDVWVLAALAAPLLTAVWAVVAVIRRAGSTVPHGPSMCLSPAPRPSHWRFAELDPQLSALSAATHTESARKADMGRWDACCDGPQLVNPTAARWWPWSKAWSPASTSPPRTSPVSWPAAGSATAAARG